MVNYTRKSNRGLFEFNIQNPLSKLMVEVNCKMKAKVEKTIKIDDGEHKGTIERIEYRDEPFNYADIIIKEDKLEIELKCGVPFKITENTSLGLMLERFGAKLDVDTEIEIEDFIKGKVTFLTVTEKTDKGRFARIVIESVKPVK